jgi:hypothetical protein
MTDLAERLIKEWEQNCFTVATHQERYLVDNLVDLHGLNADLESWLDTCETPAERHLARFVIEQLAGHTGDVTP